MLLKADPVIVIGADKVDHASRDITSLASSIGFNLNYKGISI